MRLAGPFVFEREGDVAADHGDQILDRDLGAEPQPAIRFGDRRVRIEAVRARGGTDLFLSSASRFAESTVSRSLTFFAPPPPPLPPQRPNQVVRKRRHHGRDRDGGDPGPDDAAGDSPFDGGDAAGGADSDDRSGDGVCGGDGDVGEGGAETWLRPGAIQSTNLCAIPCAIPWSTASGERTLE